jgi:hypothetical protein
MNADKSAFTTHYLTQCLIVSAKLVILTEYSYFIHTETYAFKIYSYKITYLISLSSGLSLLCLLFHQEVGSI